MTRDSWPWAGITAGLLLIAAWYAATRTTLLLAYKGGTLAQVQAVCDSGIGQVARTLSATGAASCAHIDSLSASWNAAGFAGLLLLIACGARVIYQAVTGAAASSAARRRAP